MATQPDGSWEAAIEITCGVLLCLLAPIRSSWQRTLNSIQYALAGFALGFIVSSALFYLNGNPAMQVSGFTYVTAALVGLVTMTVFVILYLITQMPLPILCTGLYTGAILSAALLTLLGQGPDKVTLGIQMILEAMAIVFSFLALFLSYKSELIRSALNTLLGVLFLMEGLDCSSLNVPVVRVGKYLNIDKQACNDSADTSKEVAVFLGCLFGAMLVILVVYSVLYAVITKALKLDKPNPALAAGGKGGKNRAGKKGGSKADDDDGSESGEDDEEEFIKKKKTAHLGKPPSKMRKKPKKTIIDSTRLPLRRWLESSQLTSAESILCQQRLAYRLHREKQEPCPNFRVSDRYNSMFDAIGYLFAVSNVGHNLPISPDGPEEIRARAVRWLLDNKDLVWHSIRIVDYVPNKDMDLFCKQIRKKRTPPTPLLLIAIASAYDCRITVYTAAEGDRYAIVIDQQSGKSNERGVKHIRLWNNHEIYGPLQRMPEDPSSSSTSSSSSSAAPVSTWQQEARRKRKNEQRQQRELLKKKRPPPRAGAVEDDKTAMNPTESGMRARSQPVSRLANIVIQVLIAIAGFWWLLWLLVWGNVLQADSVPIWSVVEYFVFLFAELINYLLGIVYFLNFCSPVQRRWRSLNQLVPKFNLSPTVDTCIFHCTEDIEDTRRTIDGCLRIDTMDSLIKLKIHVCDDGFWKPIKKKGAKPRPCWGLVDFFQRQFQLFGCGKRTSKSGDDQQDAIAAKDHNLAAKEALQPKSSRATIMPYRATITGQGGSHGAASFPSPPPEPYTTSGAAYDDGIAYAGSGAAGAGAGAGTGGYDAIYDEENANLMGNVRTDDEDVLQRVAALGFKPTRMGRQMLDTMANAMVEYFRTEHNLTVDVGYEMRFTDEHSLLRPDCAQATVRYTFFPVTDVSPLQHPELHLIARVKPVAPRTHHYKAGNANNAIFNERLSSDYLLLLDNDMKPKRHILTRMLPWFYTFVEQDGLYTPNHSIAYVQAPQHFTWDTLGPEDILCGRNGIFFTAIQRGRDGFESCAFAGTNAIFRRRALQSVQGLPYPSLTEDALLGMNLLDRGYLSIYVEDKVAVGRAPTTVAASMQQRKRWCKGSIEILLYKLGIGKPEDIEWGEEGRPRPEDEIRSTSRKRIFQQFFKLDTMVYPISGSTALLYMLVAFIFALSGEGPIYFDSNNIWSFLALLYTFLPYYLFKIGANLLSYAGSVRGEDVWRAQEAWFSYSWVSFLGLVEAVTGSSGWGLTGGADRTNNLEWFNLIAILALAISILVRFILFLANQEGLLELGAIFFAGTVLLQMWPMASMSLYERVVNTQLPEDDIEELRRAEIPTYLLYAFAVVIGIVISESISVTAPPAM